MRNVEKTSDVKYQLGEEFVSCAFNFHHISEWGSNALKIPVFRDFNFEAFIKVRY